ncbi:MAG: YkgJ family cysteine cluster protein [Candidatus Margulisiibacteriota bacterium]
MQIVKRIIIFFVLLDNFLTNTFKNLFGTKWKIVGKCNQCGTCCKRILMVMTPAQIRSPLFTGLSIRWISWLFDFILLDIDHERNYLAFTCSHLTPEGKCGNYFWRPNVCRNFPLVEYFEKPVLLDGCGYEINRSE